MEILSACASHVTGLVQVKEVWCREPFYDKSCHIRKWIEEKKNQGQPGRHQEEKVSLSESMKCSCGAKLQVPPQRGLILGNKLLTSVFRCFWRWKLKKKGAEINQLQIQQCHHEMIIMTYSMYIWYFLFSISIIVSFHIDQKCWTNTSQNTLPTQIKLKHSQNLMGMLF